jgi:hypothetical protein
MGKVEAGRIVVGATYKYLRGGEYRVEALAWDPVHMRDMVVYTGQAGADAGRWYVCSPADFVHKFQALERSVAHGQ